ncbi:hypothetical protein Y032_0030g2215 [Ancylostoma ceylanicum]|nr:hypothetical protein Y032_0030g2215 [Ancylostoma ceylanicum]
MLSLYLLILVAVSLSTAEYQGGQKPEADCKVPVEFPQGKRDTFIKNINERRQLMVKGEQKNGKNGGKLPKGENVLEMEWSCELERKAIDALNKTCSPKSPDAQTTGLLYQDNGSKQDPMDVWLSEINDKSIELHSHPEAPVKYTGVNERYCNLVRYDAPHIGCAERECDGKKTTFCLIDQPPLQKGDVVYYWGKGECPTGKCRPPSSGCHTETGLCFKPVPTTTPATTTGKRMFCHPFYGCVEV